MGWQKCSGIRRSYLEGSLILPVNSGHPTKRVNSQPEVTHGKISINQQEAP